MTDGIQDNAKKILQKNGIIKKTDDYYTCISLSGESGTYRLINDKDQKYHLKRKNGKFMCHCLGYVFKDNCSHLEALRQYREEVEGESAYNESTSLGNLKLYNVYDSDDGNSLGLIQTKLDKDTVQSLLNIYKTSMGTERDMSGFYIVINGVDPNATLIMPSSVEL